MAVTAVAAAHAKAAGKAKDRLVPRATAHPPPDAMAHKVHPALKVKVRAAEKVGVMAVVAKSNVGIPVLTTARMAKAVQPHGARVQKVAAVAVKGVKVAAKTVAVWMATNCLATSIP